MVSGFVESFGCVVMVSTAADAEDVLGDFAGSLDAEEMAFFGLVALVAAVVEDAACSEVVVFYSVDGLERSLVAGDEVVVHDHVVMGEMAGPFFLEVGAAEAQIDPEVEV